MSGRVDCRIKHQGTVHVPVSVNVLRARCPSAGLVIVGHPVTDTVARVAIIQKRHDGPLLAFYIVVVEKPEVVGERRFQSRITHGDIQRVAIVGDIEQLRHARLRGCAPVIDAKIAHLAEAIAEIERRRDISDPTHRVDMNSLIILHVLRLLWLHHHAHIEIILLTDDTQHQLEVVDIIAIFGITTQPLVEIASQRIGQSGEISVPCTIAKGKTAEEVLA